MPKVVLAFNSLDQAIEVFTRTPPHQNVTVERRQAALQYLTRLAYNKTNDEALIARIKDVLKSVLMAPDNFALSILPDMSRAKVLFMGADMAAEVLAANRTVGSVSAERVLYAQCGQALAMYDGEKTGDRHSTEGHYAPLVGNSPYYKAGILEKKIVNGVFGQPGKTVGNMGGVNLILMNDKEDELEELLQKSGQREVVAEALKDLFALDSYDDIMLTQWGWGNNFAREVKGEPDIHPYWAVVHLMQAYPSKRDPIMVRNFMEKSSDRPDIRQILATKLIENFSDGTYPQYEDEPAFYNEFLTAIGYYGTVSCLQADDPVFSKLMSLPGGMAKKTIDQFLSNYSFGDCTDEQILAALKDRYHSAQNDDDALQYFISNADRFHDKLKQIIADPSRPDSQIKAIREGLPLIYGFYNQDELAALWDAVPYPAKLAILETVGNKWPKNTLMALARGQDKQIADIASRLLGGSGQAAPIKPVKDIEASTMKRTVVAAIDDMADALRKMKSPDGRTAWEAAEFLTKVASPESIEALRAYLFSPRYNETVGHMILKNGRKALGDEYTNIAAQVLWSKHRDRVLVAQAAQVVGSAYRSLTPDLDAMPLVQAAQAMKGYFKSANSTGTAVEEATDNIIRLYKSSPDMVRAFKDILSLQDSADIFSSNYKNDDNPSWLVADLVREYPEQSDLVMLKNYFEKPQSWIGAILWAYSDGLKKLKPKIKQSDLGLYDALAGDMMRTAAKSHVITAASQSSDFLYKLPDSYATQFLDAYEKTPQGLSQPEPIEDLREKLALRSASLDKRLGIFKERPDKHKKEIYTLIWTQDKDQATAVRQLLPLVYGEMDQGSMSRLWEESGTDVRVAILETVGNRWPVNALVALANGTDAVAGAAAKILAERQQSHLVPRHMREPEL